MPIDRRQLISGFAAAAVTSHFSTEANALAPAKVRPLGIQLYTVRKEMAEDFEGTLARIAEMGFKEVEFFNLYGKSARDVRTVLDRNGLVAPSTHTLIKPLQDNLNQLLDDCHAMGHRYLTVAFLMPNERETIDQYRAHAETLKRAAETCAQAGVQLAYHNHDFEFVAIDGTVPYEVLMEETSAQELALELDLYWVSKAGLDPLTYLAKDPMRFPLVHVKDMADSEQQEFTEVGTGVIDFAKIFASPHSRGIRHLLVEQDTIKGDTWQSIATSLAGLQSVLL